jgi:hypothetical protein
LSAELIKNMMFEEKKTKLQNKGHFLGYETDIMQHLFKMQ